MHIERVPNRNSPPAVLLRQSYREEGKVRKRTLANLSKLPPEAVEGLKILLKGGTAIDKARINEQLKNIEGLDWITALRPPQTCTSRSLGQSSFHSSTLVVNL
jgi:hypothetical protein